LYILSIGKHWVCLSTIGCESYTWKIYDRLSYNFLMLINAFKSIYLTEYYIFVQREKVQQQKGSSDCGLFALANLVWGKSGFLQI
jgi:Ulp1 family protease